MMLILNGKLISQKLENLITKLGKKYILSLLQGVY